MRFYWCSAILLAAVAGAALAQHGDLAKAEVKAQRIAPGVAVLMGAGGNIGLSFGEDGNALVDDQFAPLTDEIIAAVRTIDPDPVRFVINTHWHGDHTGGNENFGKAGAVILAHDNVRARMSVESFSSRFKQSIKASPKGALPAITFAEGASLHLNGDVLRIVHVRNAHTDGDSLVLFTKAKVLHMGDIFFNKMSLPYIDRESGGSIDGLIAAVRTGLAMVGDDARIIPGHGPMATRSELAAYLAMLEDVRGKVHAGLAAGRGRDEVVAAKLAAAYEIPGGFISADDFVGTVYDSLAAAAKR